MPEERLRRIDKEVWMNVNRNDVNVKACHVFARLNKHIAEVRLSHAQIKSLISIYPEKLMFLLVLFAFLSLKSSLAMSRSLCYTL
jgi:hypothetical protein